MLRASAIPPDGDRAVGRANCSGQKRPFGRWFTLGQRYERRSGNSRDGLRDAPTRDMAVLASMAAGAACATLADEPCAGQARCGGAGEVNRAGSDLGVPAGTVKSVEGLAAIASAGTFACWCSAAQAYRPFDGTDAAVVETGEVEIELGPVGYLRAGADRTLSVPNLGLKPPTFWSRADL